jgi:hypothetical protein
MSPENLPLAQVFRPVPLEGADGYYVDDQGGFLSGRAVNGRGSRIFLTSQMLRRKKITLNQFGYETVSIQHEPKDGKPFAKTRLLHTALSRSRCSENS